MQNTIQYRPFKRQDIQPFQTVINESWRYDQQFTQATARHLSAIMLYYGLSRQSFAQVATSNGDPIGLIIGNTKQTKLSNVIYYPLIIWHFLGMLASKEGRGVLKFYVRDAMRLSRKLTQQIDQPFDGELALFAVSPRAQGLGVGTQLYQFFLTTFRKNQLSTFFLQTDTTCNYSFYDHKGLTRAASVRQRVTVPEESTIGLFIYTGKI